MPISQVRCVQCSIHFYHNPLRLHSLPGPNACSRRCARAPSKTWKRSRRPHPRPIDRSPRTPTSACGARKRGWCASSSMNSERGGPREYLGGMHMRKLTFSTRKWSQKGIRSPVSQSSRLDSGIIPCLTTAYRMMHIHLVTRPKVAKIHHPRSDATENASVDVHRQDVERLHSSSLSPEASRKTTECSTITDLSPSLRLATTPRSLNHAVANSAPSDVLGTSRLTSGHGGQSRVPPHSLLNGTDVGGCVSPSLGFSVLPAGSDFGTLRQSSIHNLYDTYTRDPLEDFDASPFSSTLQHVDPAIRAGGNSPDIVTSLLQPTRWGPELTTSSAATWGAGMAGEQLEQAGESAPRVSESSLAPRGQVTAPPNVPPFPTMGQPSPSTRTKIGLEDVIPRHIALLINELYFDYVSCTEEVAASVLF
jgi:hypothetical protein